MICISILHIFFLFHLFIANEDAQYACVCVGGGGNFGIYIHLKNKVTHYEL